MEVKNNFCKSYVQFRDDDIASAYTNYFGDNNPSKFIYYFNTSVDYIDRLHLGDSKMIFKHVHHVSNSNGKKSIYKNIKLLPEVGDDLENSMTFILDSSNIMFNFHYSRNEDKTKSIDESLVSECVVICWFNALEYTANDVQCIVNGLLSDVKLYSSDIFIDTEVNLIIADDGYLDTVPFKVNPPDIDFNLNYSDGFVKIHDSIIKGLSNDKGLFMFHGIPGSGKTMYIRYLMKHICTVLRKQVIYVPSDSIHRMCGPEFISFLSENKNSVFIMEDADADIRSRDSFPDSSVSNILNLTDGVLNDCFNVQIILTFNTDISDVDKALLRNGRLLCLHEFKKITAKQATELSSILGHNIVYKSDQVLSNVYTPNGCSVSDGSKKIGFL